MAKFFQLLSLIALPISYFLYMSEQNQVKENLNYIGLPQKEITSGGELLDKKGAVIDSGWSKNALKRFNSEELSSFQNQLRLKKWDYFQIIHEKFFFSIALADLGFVQDVQVTFYELEGQTFIHKDQILIPFIHDKLNLTDNFYTLKESKIQTFKSDELSFTFNEVNVDGDKEQRFLNLSMNYQGHILKLNVRLDSSVADDLIAMYQPINSKKTQFFYNVKAFNWLPIGQLTFNKQKFEITQQGANAGVDWGRGIWNYHTFYLWSSGMGFLENGQRFAINLGGGFQDDKSSLATEDAIFINKKLFKLKDIVYEYDLTDLDLPFVFRSHDVQKNQFNLTFAWDQQNSQRNINSKRPETDTNVRIGKPPLPGQFYCEFIPIHKNSKNTNFLVISMSLEYFIGKFSGAYVNPSGQIIEFHNIDGITEFNKARW